MADAKRIIRLNFKAYLAENDKLYDTNVEEAAKSAGVFDEKMTYAPMAYIVGSSALYPILDQAIAAAKVGEEFTVDVPCEQGPGVRNPKLMETHKMGDFKDMEYYPAPGMTVSLGNRTGTILKVGAGRVVVDFNNPLAGHDLKYVMTVTEEISDNAAKAAAVIEADFGNQDDFKFDFPGDKVVVTLPELTKFHQQWPVARFRIVSDLRDVFGVDTVEFIEIWSAAKKADAAEKKEEEKKE